MNSPSRLLDGIRNPEDLKALAPEQLPQLAREIREELIAVTARNGGHIGPNLGVVELSLVLHRVFSTPEDRLVFDVAHQGYVHKLLTGRGGSFFQKLRRTGGASGFLTRAESPHDAYGAGHAGTALSAALGMATARDRLGGSEHVVAICGDAAFTCGITLEALNNVVSSTRRLIVILNDNEWSIAKNVGAISSYLNRLSTSPTYNKLHHDLESFFGSLPGGSEMNRLYNKWKRETKDFIVGSSLFEKFGLRYLGPVDGHDIEALTKNLEFAKRADAPVLIHVLTKKGQGLDPAINFPEKFHGASPYDPATGKSASPAALSYSEVFGQSLLHFARQDKRVLAITAAMPSGTGLSEFASELPEQFFDVGIAEEHAAIFAAGLATQGFRPVCAIYSTFLQRAYDPIIHDVALQNLPVTFCLDRAGLSPNDGPTHHGLFDFSYLRCIPNTVVMQPKDGDELHAMLGASLQHPGPTFIRYPRGAAVVHGPSQPAPAITFGQAELLRSGSNLMIWALGPMVDEALRLAEQLTANENLSVGVVNARFVKPLDRTLLLSHAACIPLIVTMEDHVLTGGFGSAVLEELQEARCPAEVERIGWPDHFIEHGSGVNDLRAAHGLDTETLYRRILDRWKRINAERISVSS